MTTTIPYTKKPFASSILLWVRTDQPRQTGMDYWKGPHSKIISATPGFDEYRQIHLAETNPGLWPATRGVETAIPADRKIDGVAEVTFRSALSPLLGRKQTRLAYKDEINVFRRTLLYAGPPNSSRWYEVAGPARRSAPAPSSTSADETESAAARSGSSSPKNSYPRSRNRRDDRTADPGLHALEREALGHPERRARQPRRPAVPRLADARLRRRSRAGGFLRQR